jgi:hypothetical protein
LIALNKAAGGPRCRRLRGNLTGPAGHEQIVRDFQESSGCAMIRSEARLESVHHSIILLNVCGHLFAHDFLHNLGQGNQDTDRYGSQRVQTDRYFCQLA